MGTIEGEKAMRRSPRIWFQGFLVGALLATQTGVVGAQIPDPTNTGVQVPDPIETVDPASHVPHPGIEYRIAHYLLGPGNDVALARRVIDALVGHPKRYADLRPLLGGKSDNHLTRVVKWLDGTGLVWKRAASDGEVLYELDALGKSVLRKLAALEEAEAWRRYEVATGESFDEPATH